MSLTTCDLCLSWSVLEIESNENVADEQQAFAAGYLEGKLTKGDFFKDISIENFISMEILLFKI